MLEKNWSLHYKNDFVSFSCSRVIHPFSTLTLLRDGGLLSSSEASSSDTEEVNGLNCLVIEHDGHIWIKPEPHGRTTVNHNILSQPSFCGLVTSSPLFMYACRRQAKLLHEDDQSWVQPWWWGGFTATAHHSRSTTDLWRQISRPSTIRAKFPRFRQ